MIPKEQDCFLKMCFHFFLLAQVFRPMELDQDQEKTEQDYDNYRRQWGDETTPNRDRNGEVNDIPGIARMVNEELHPFSTSERSECAILQDAEIQPCLGTEVGKGPFGCVRCDKSFDNRDHLERHTSTCKGESSMSCDLCGKSFSFKASLKLHKRIHTDERPYKCDQCGKAFRRKYTLDEHKHIHSNVKPFSCELCGKCFSSKPNFKRHKHMHMGETENVCFKCGKVFGDEAGLEAHGCAMTNKLLNVRQAGGQTKHETGSIRGESSTGELPLHVAQRVTDDKTSGSELKDERLSLPMDVKDQNQEATWQENYGIRSRNNAGGIAKNSNLTDKPALCCDQCGKLFSNKSSLAKHKHIHSGEKPFVCDVCGKAFHLKTSLRDHKDIHSREKLYSCDACGKAFAQLPGLRAHKKHIHEGMKYKPRNIPPCDQCGKTLSSKVNLLKHKLSHANDNTFICDQCGKVFSHEHSLKEHKLVHSVEMPYACNDCGTGFVDLTALQEHQRCAQEGGMPCHEAISCDQCGKSFCSKTTLATHRLIHTGEKHFVCDICGKAFHLKTSLNDHKDLHKEEKSYSCDICGKAFAQLPGLRAHKKHVHEGVKYKPRNIPPCDQCGKIFSSKLNLNKHKLSHTSEKTFMCDQCGKAFSQEDNLKEHKLLHLTEFPYPFHDNGKGFVSLTALQGQREKVRSDHEVISCEQCGKTFSSMACLQRHKTIHTGEMPFVCVECGKGFRRKTHLEGHKNVHSTKKPFSCNQCGTTFCRKSSLVKHELKFHQGDKPLVCEYCFETFQHCCRLSEHLQTHTGEKAHACDQCGTSFRSTDDQSEEVFTRLTGSQMHVNCSSSTGGEPIHQSDQYFPHNRTENLDILSHKGACPAFPTSTTNGPENSTLSVTKRQLDMTSKRQKEQNDCVEQRISVTGRTKNLNHRPLV